jgi:hypothetical protein
LTKHEKQCILVLQGDKTVEKDNETEFYEALSKILGFPPEAAKWSKGEPLMPFKFAILQAVKHFVDQGFIESEPIADHPQLQPFICPSCGTIHSEPHDSCQN